MVKGDLSKCGGIAKNIYCFLCFRFFGYIFGLFGHDILSNEYRRIDIRRRHTGVLEYNSSISININSRAYYHRATMILF